jgi:alpha-aminoadipate/glutamate carrier protein LysW
MSVMAHLASSSFLPQFSGKQGYRAGSMIGKSQLHVGLAEPTGPSPFPSTKRSAPNDSQSKIHNLKSKMNRFCRWTSSEEMNRLLCGETEVLKGRMDMAHCPECEATIEIEDDVEEGAKLDCPDCGAELEVVNTNPVELDVISSGEGEEEEDGTW